jgi:hypothetical protein
MAAKRTCSKYADWAASSVAAGELPPMLREHVDACGECRCAEERITAELERLDRLVSGRGAKPDSPELADRVLDSLPTPAWRLRSLRSWLFPVGTLAALGLGSVSLLHPLPRLLAEEWAPLAALRSPLALLGESAALLWKGAEVVSRSAGVGGAHLLASLAALAAAVALGWGVARMGGASPRRAWERGRS